MKELDYKTFSRRLHETALRERIPLVGSLATSYRCNLDCRHCYLDGCRDLARRPVDDWLGWIDQIAAAGCLWLVLSGGEPLLDPDFERLYRHAKGKGLLLGVFTNGTLIDDAILELWRELPPYVVEVSLYGYTDATYAAVTGRPEARDAVFAAVRGLADSRIPTRLKSMVLRQNVDDIARLRDFAAELGLAFRSDPMVSSGLHGSPRPLESRLDAETILEMDDGDLDAQAGWDEFLGCQQVLAARKSLFSCGGGRKFFFIDPSGGLCLCPFDPPVYDLTRGSFLDGWNGPVRDRRARELPPGHPCRDCQDEVFCGICPAVARMETGSDLGRPDALCRLGKQRSRTIRSRVAKKSARSSYPTSRE